VSVPLQPSILHIQTTPITIAKVLPNSNGLCDNASKTCKTDIQCLLLQTATQTCGLQAQSCKASGPECSEAARLSSHTTSMYWRYDYQLSWVVANSPGFGVDFRLRRGGDGSRMCFRPGGQLERLFTTTKLRRSVTFSGTKETTRNSAKCNVRLSIPLWRLWLTWPTLHCTGPRLCESGVERTTHGRRVRLVIGVVIHGAVLENNRVS
jgi:hypothetical protein